MFILLLLIAALFGLGFLHPLWWAAAAVLVFGYAHYSRNRDRGGNSEYREYRDRRDRQDRWDRRYSRQRRGHWNRQDRRDRIRRR